MELSEPKTDILLDHMAERIAAILKLPEKRLPDVVEALTLMRESFAIWTMHDLPRPVPSVPDAAPVAVDDAPKLVRFLSDDPHGLWKAGDVAEDLGWESTLAETDPDFVPVRLFRLSGETLNITDPFERGIVAATTAPSPEPDDYLAWCREVHRGQYEDSGADIITLELCDSDATGAFKVYRATTAAPSPVGSSLETLIVSMCPVHGVLITRDEGHRCEEYKGEEDIRFVRATTLPASDEPLDADTVPCPCCKKPLVGAGGLCTNCWEAHNSRLLSDEQLAEAQRLYEQTTPGKWGRYNDDYDAGTSLVAAAPFSPKDADIIADSITHAPNANFIAAAHNLWPKFVARAQGEEVAHVCTQTKGMIRPYPAAHCHDCKGISTPLTSAELCAFIADYKKQRTRGAEAGGGAALQGRAGEWGCPDVERLLHALKTRLEAARSAEREGVKDDG